MSVLRFQRVANRRIQTRQKVEIVAIGSKWYNELARVRYGTAQMIRGYIEGCCLASRK